MATTFRPASVTEYKAIPEAERATAQAQWQQQSETPSVPTKNSLWIGVKGALAGLVTFTVTAAASVFALARKVVKDHLGTQSTLDGHKIGELLAEGMLAKDDVTRSGAIGRLSDYIGKDATHFFNDFKNAVIKSRWVGIAAGVGVTGYLAHHMLGKRKKIIQNEAVGELDKLTIANHEIAQDKKKAEHEAREKEAKHHEQPTHHNAPEHEKPEHLKSEHTQPEHHTSEHQKPVHETHVTHEENQLLNERLARGEKSHAAAHDKSTHEHAEAHHGR